MKARFVLLAAMIALALPIFAIGVLVTGQDNSQYYNLYESEVTVSIEDQVALVTTRQTFINSFSTNTPKYVFPMPEGASATLLRWQYDGEWHLASFAPVPQDSLPPNPGPGWPMSLTAYMGATPLFFNILDEVETEAEISVELSYVMLLPYAWGNVRFQYPMNYNVIQSQPFQQSVHFELNSQRSIMGVDVSGLPVTITNDGHHADFEYSGSSVGNDLTVVYTLDPEQFGLFSLSTMVDEVPDSLPNGFFALIVEPDPANSSVVINKTFSLIIDVSGSMSGMRIINARNAASYIVEHLNPADMFNIIAFSTDAQPMWTEHRVASTTNTLEALSFISSLNADGWTNMSEAFSATVPQFNEANPEHASIIIFITDGEPTTGITETNALRQYVSGLISEAPVTINLFTFGVGASYSRQLLTLLATDNNGEAAFLEDSDFETAITSFYNLIANPVLIHPTITFTPEGQISEVYPNPLPNVYQGSQLLISGRYLNGGATDLELEGQSYAADVSYEYNMTLADSLVTEKQFLTKIWAKMKIQHLLALYYGHAPNSAEAEAIKQQIIDVSLAYGVLSPFTSFVDDGGGGISNDDEVIVPDLSTAYILKGNFPNPFNPSTTIHFSVHKELQKMVRIKVYNLRGQIVKTLGLMVNGKGEYQIVWDGRDVRGKLQPSGIYFYVIDFGDAQLSGRMVMSK